MAKEIKIELPPEYDAVVYDYKDYDVCLKKHYGYNGNLYFKKIPIDMFNEDSNIISFLNEYLKKNNLNKKDYDIFYKKGKEWYSKLYLYKKID